MSTLAGRIAVVSGGGNGLGRAIAGALADAGVRVIAVGRRPVPVEATAEALSTPGRHETVDVADPRSVAALRDQLSDEDISILVNNAGVAGPVAPMWQVGPDQWDDVFAVNVRGVYLMSRAFIPAMLARGRGTILNVASVSGKRPLTARTPYSASKMAVIGLTRTLAMELGPHGIAVNTLSPGPVAGPRMDRNFRLDSERRGVSVAEAESDFVSRAALGRMVTEGEVASAAVRVLEMDGLTGADLDLSGGMVAP